MTLSTANGEVTMQETTYFRRWYDEDPELSYIVSKLEYATDEIKSKVSLLIIKTIINKNVLSNDYEDVEDMLISLNAGYMDPRRSRWYDTNSTTRTAMQMLHDLPPESRSDIIYEIKHEYRYMSVFPI